MNPSINLKPQSYLCSTQAVGFAVLMASLLVFIPKSNAQQVGFEFIDIPVENLSHQVMILEEIDQQQAVKVYESPATILGMLPETLPRIRYPLDETIVTNPTAAVNPLAVVKVGLEIWKVIERNAAVTTATAANVSALPVTERNWTGLTGWKKLNNLIVSHEFKNLYGMNVATIKYRVSALTNGSILGKGQYIANAQVVPVDVQAMWGYKVHVNARSGSAVNISTDENPNALLQLDVEWGISTIMKSIIHTDSFDVKGSGSLLKVAD
jgi:hypothetical protein